MYILGFVFNEDRYFDRDVRPAGGVSKQFPECREASVLKILSLTAMRKSLHDPRSE